MKHLNKVGKESEQRRELRRSKNSSVRKEWVRFGYEYMLNPIFRKQGCEKKNL